METTSPTPVTPAVSDRIERPRKGRVLAGVAVALADRLGISVGVTRLAFMIAALFAGSGIVAYAAAWVLLPSDDEEHSPASRWLQDLQTPGRRAGAALIGVAGLIILVPFLPGGLLVAAAILIAALALRRNTTTKES